MRIAYIGLKGLPLGYGIEKYTEELGERLVTKGHHVTAYTMRSYGSQDGFHNGIRVITLPSINRRSMQKMSITLLSSLHYLQHDEYDIVHYHAIGPSLLSFLPRLKRCKVVVQAHGLEWKRAKWGFLGKTFFRFSEFSAARFPDVLTVVSQTQKRYFHEKYGTESIYIPPGVNPPRIQKPDLIKTLGLEGNDYILFAARLVKEKGCHYLIQAFNGMNTNLKLVVAGDAEHEEKYKSWLKDLANGNQNIIFPGFVTGKLKDELFSNAYLFVTPSEIEGLSTSLLEAISYGNCCLVSDIPENLEAVDKYGYSFTNQNAEDLREKLEDLLQNSQKVHALKEAARNHVLKNFSWDSIADKFEVLYQNLLK